MPRQCTVCTHPEVHAVNVALVCREPYCAISREYSLGRDALRRHAREHIPELLAQAKRAVEVAEADDLLSRVEALHSRTLAILEAAEASEQHTTALAAIREARSNLEFVGRLTKELESAPTVNVHLNPEWIELRTLIISALEPYTAARASVLRALSGSSNGGT